MDCRVVVEAAVSVYDVETVDEAVRIAISKTGELLNPDLNYVEIDMGSPTGPDGEALPAAYIVADEALVALELTMDVFNVEQEEHAKRVARTEIGKRLSEIPLEVVSVEEIPEDEVEGKNETDASKAEEPVADGDTGADEGESDDTGAEESEGDDVRGDDTGADGSEGDNVRGDHTGEPE
ncbi:MAG: DUF555 domain-containing protein [Halonotius sp.]